MSSSLYGQSTHELKNILDDSTSPSDKMARVERYLNKERLSNNDSLAYLYNQYAYWLFDYDLNKTIKFEALALKTAKSQKEIDTVLLQKSAVSLGFYYERNQQIKKAIEAYKDVVLLKNPGRYETNTYGKLGYCHGLINDYYSAIDYYKVQIALLEKDKNDLRRLRDAYTNTASYLILLEQKDKLEEAERYAIKADSLAQIIPTPFNEAFSIKICLAQRYNQFEDLNVERSDFYYQQALTLAMEEEDSTEIQKVYYEKGALYNSTDPELSIDYFNKAQDLSTGKNPFIDYLVTSGLSTSWAFKENFIKSISYRKKAIKQLVNIEVDNPKLDSLIIVSPYKTNLLNDFAYLGEIQLSQYEVTQDHTLLEQSLKNFKRADAIIDLLKLNSTEFKSRLFWRRLSATVYDKAIYVSTLLKDTQQAFYFAEKNKALLLLEDLSQQSFRNAANIATHLLAKEQRLKEQLLVYKTSTDLNNPDLQKRIIDTKISLSKLQDSMYTQDFQFSLNPTVTSLSSIREQLKKDEIFIEYHISEADTLGILKQDAKAFVFIVSKQQTLLKSLDNFTEMRPKILSLLATYKNPFKTKEDIERYQKNSEEIFTYLLPIQKLEGGLNGKKLIITPDNLLSFLPFEALHTDINNSNSFLLRQCEIQYAYSFSFLHSLSKSDANTSQNFLGIAPGQFKNDYLRPLGNSIQEVEQLNQFFDGKHFTNQEATKEILTDQMNSASIIHLATHADASEGQTPWIGLYDDKITLQELYEIPNEASLVFLSGCNTSLGKIETGEGVMSLARGFFYSGSQSVISTLWSIDDRSTQEITANFYHNLSQGRTSSQALREAKLQYLDNNGLSEASPHYWASFVLLGADNPIPSSNNFSVFILGIGILLFIGFLIVYKKKFQKKSKQ